ETKKGPNGPFLFRNASRRSEAVLHAAANGEIIRIVRIDRCLVDGLPFLGGAVKQLEAEVHLRKNAKLAQPRNTHLGATRRLRRIRGDLTEAQALVLLRRRSRRCLASLRLGRRSRASLLLLERQRSRAGAYRRNDAH